VIELLSIEKIQKRVKELAGEISKDYNDRVPILIGVLNGSFIFLSDLARELTIDCEVDFIKVNSYDGKESSGTVHLLKDISADITNRHIILVEDIVDSGLTMNFLIKRLEGSNPASVAVVTLLFKSEIAQLNLELNYVGFEIPSDFVVGYGLDVEQKMRNLKSIYRLEENDF
tara:strand:- start:24822 stop:25337 length:516 start_codon:yes stop_codon:yes gene_type:complete